MAQLDKLVERHTCVSPMQVMKHANCACLHASRACGFMVPSLDEILTTLGHLHIFKNMRQN